MEVLNPKTNRYVKVGSQGYKRLVREGVIKPAETPTVPQITPIKQEAAPKPVEEPYDEAILQNKLAEISTQMISSNLKKNR
jgi:hypothetical protein